jgi:hypothetical protein
VTTHCWSERRSAWSRRRTLLVRAPLPPLPELQITANYYGFQFNSKRLFKITSDYCIELDIAAPLQHHYYKLLRHYCRITTVLLQITLELLHHYFYITTPLLHITASLLRHYNIITTYYHRITASIPFITMIILRITSSSLDPLLHHYYSITT